MTKKEYQKPAMEVIEADIELQILAGSVTSVTTTGLDDDKLSIGEDDEKSGDAWDYAW